MGNQTPRTQCKRLKCQWRGTDKEAGEVRGLKELETELGLERQRGFGHVETAREGKASRQREQHEQRHGGGKARRHVEKRATSQVWLNKGPSKQGLGQGLYLCVSGEAPEGFRGNKRIRAGI